MERNKKKLKYAYEIIVDVLKDLGYNSDADLANLLGTVDRATRSFTEMILPKEDIEKLINSYSEVSFPSKYHLQNMIVLNAIDVVSICPHHLIPVMLTVTVGYIPTEKVLGLSKIIRMADVLAKQPILQEDYTLQLAQVFIDKVKAAGVGVYVKGLHGCMLCRGVRRKSKTITTSLQGSFLSDAKVKQEFLHYI